MGSTAKDVPAVALVYPMQMEKNVLEEVLQAEAVSGNGKALTPEEVVARLPAAPTNPGAADMMVVVDSMLRQLAIRRDVRFQEDDKDGKNELRYSTGPVDNVAASGISDSLPFWRVTPSLLGGKFMRRFMLPPAACVVDIESGNKEALPVTTSADGTGDKGSADILVYVDVIPYYAKSAFTGRDAGEHGNCGPGIFPETTNSDVEMGSNQPTSGDNASSAEVGSTAGSDPWQVSLIVAVLGGVTAVMGLVAAVLGVWKINSSKKV